MHTWFGILTLGTTLFGRHAVGLQEPAPVPVQDPVPAAPENPTVAPEPVRPALVWDPRYHDGAAVRELLTGWHAAAPGLGLVAELFELGATHSARGTVALRVGRTGPPLAERPALVLLGGLDGVSLTGSEAVLSVLARVFAHPAELPENTVLVAVPWAAPDALERALAGELDGRDLRPVDDDGDRIVDEDGPEDLDGDGQILELIVEDPEGTWVRGPDARFLIPAKPGETPRYRRGPEGRDDDGDGRFNEDPKGGVRLANAFPERYVPSGSLATGLTLPLEDEHARSLCALLVETKPLCVLTFQGDHGGVAVTALDTPAVLANVQTVARSFARSTAKAEEPVRLLADLGRDAEPGSALRWMRSTLGACVAEIAPWGPEVEHAQNGASASPASARRDTGRAALDALDELDRSWARWLDDTRGGIGFVDWHPVDLGPSVRALVGGWQNFTRRNAPEAVLPAAIANVPAGVFALLAQFPVLDPDFTEARRDGELCFLRARVKNCRAFGCSGRVDLGAELRTELVLPAGARLIAGAERQGVAALGGGEASRELAWTVLAPAQSTFRLRVELPWGGEAIEEVRP